MVILKQYLLIICNTAKKNMSRQHSSNASVPHHTGSSALRKALSPLSSLCSNVVSFNHQDPYTKNTELHNSQTGYKTPTKTYQANDENRTPKAMPMPVPATPPTACSTMHTAKTPFTPGVRATEEIEYSFEERRAGFVIPKTLSLVDV